MFNLPFLTKKVFKVLLLHFLLLFMSAHLIAQDTDGDGIANAMDPDDDNDEIPDEFEEFLLHSNFKPACDGASAADFRQPANLISGENNEVGAVYRIENVYTGIDVLVEIEQLENVSGLTVDNNESNETAFQPITVAENTEDGQEVFVQYKFTFVSMGTTTPVVVPSIYANIADIDGNTGINGDIIYFANHSSYTLQEPTSMTLTNSVYDNDLNWTKIVAGTEEVDGIDTLDKSAMITPRFSNVTTFHMRVGFVSRGDHGNITRPARIDFTCIADYSSPSTYVVDFDEDGVRNTVDLDSDNDGIADVTESGVSGDGDIVLRDTDNDGNPDFLDLDSDGDGITDLVESQTSAGFINLTFSDEDGDGIDNAFDADAGFGPVVILEPVNTEGGDNEDYRDLDSDNDNKEDRLEGWDADNDGTANTVPLDADADFDGLDDGYDADISVVNPGNGQTPDIFPNTGGTDEKDWRDPYIDNPIAFEDLIEASEDVTLDLSKVFENDVISDDGPSATAPFTITQDPENGTIEIDDNGTPEDFSDNIYRYTPSENFSGTDSFIYKVCDIDEDCDTALVTITVLPVNDAPVATNLRGSVDPAVTLIVDLSTAVSDVDANTIFSYNVISSPVGTSASISPAGELNYTPTENNTSRRDTVIYEVCDNGTPALCSRGIVSVTVPDAVTTDEDMEVTFTISADDLNPSSIEILVEPKNGDATVDESKNGIVYTPNENFSGEDSIRYTYCNNSAICDTAWILFIVNPVNDAPSANNVIASVDPAVEILIDLSEQVNDIDVPTEFTYRVVSTPGDSKASINTEGILSFTPSESRNPRRDTVLYEVCDNGIPQLCTTALVIVTVPDAVNTNEDTAVEFEVFGEAIDLSSIAILTDPLYGTTTLDNSTGIILYTPEENFNGFDSIRYTFCNQAGDVCDTTWLVYLVSAVNDAPIVSNEFHNTEEDTQVSGNLLGDEDYDIEDTDLNVGQIILQPAHGTLLVNNDGTYTYTPALNYFGTDMAIVNLCDSGDPLPAQCVGDTIFITINPVNDTPVTISDNFIAGIGKGPLRDKNFNDNNYDVENSTIVFNRIIKNTTHGVFLPEANGNFVYTVSESAPGVIDTAIVEICESPSSSPTLCSFDTIYFDIKQYLFISEGFTPNNDGNNDFFWVETLIPGNINLEVFNRWGTMVYSNSNYTNNWFGISNVGSDNGNTVPDGTYYYQITFGNGEVRRNYITILK